MTKRFIIAAATFATLSSSAMAGNRLMAFDVAEDHTAFVSAPAPVFEDDGYTAHGNPFVTQGYFYPAGTLVDDASGMMEHTRLGFTWFMGVSTTFEIPETVTN